MAGSMASGCVGLQAELQGFCPCPYRGPVLIALAASSETLGNQGVFPGTEGYVRGGLLQTARSWRGNRNLWPQPLS